MKRHQLLMPLGISGAFYAAVLREFARKGIDINQITPEEAEAKMLEVAPH